MHLYCTDCHDLLTVTGRQLADQQHDERVQLRYLHAPTLVGVTEVVSWPAK